MEGRYPLFEQNYVSNLHAGDKNTGVVFAFRKTASREIAELVRTANDLGAMFEKLGPSLGSYEGRRPVNVYLIGGTRVVVKIASHGGSLAFLTGDRYSSLSRFQHEIETTLLAIRFAIPAIPVEALLAEKRGLFYRVAIVTEEVPDSVDLLEFLRLPLDRKTRTDGIRKAARLLMRFHDAGFCHDDLNLKNILVTLGGAGVNVRILDLGQTKFSDTLHDSARFSNLLRLKRSVEKQKAKTALEVSGSEQLLFLREYFADRDRDFVRKAARRLAKNFALHRALW
ncbi:MAG: phosphotransferase [Planctomycetes bacterium]|nr:phosphotransferase [Planctomycetota bacterium]